MATTYLRRASAWLLTLSLTGCTVSFHPMGMGKPSHNDHYSADWYGQGGPPPGVNPAFANHGRPPMGMPNGSPNELSQMRERAMMIDDDRKALLGRLQQIEAQMVEKDQAIVKAVYEIRESTKQIRQTRDEVQNWKQEIDDVRGRIRNVERENRQTLETVVKTLESYLDRDKGGSTSSGPRH